MYSLQRMPRQWKSKNSLPFFSRTGMMHRIEGLFARISVVVALAQPALNL